MQIKLLAEGGDMKPGPTLSQKLGPIGVNINQVIQKVNDVTKEFKGLKVPIELDIDTRTKNINVKVFSPPVSELLKKELGIEKASGIQKKMKVANASIEQIISIAKSKLPNLLCKNLKTAVKTVLGSCASLGILVESKPSSQIQQEIEAGKYSKEIKEEKTETSEGKKEKLKVYFEKIKEEQEKIIKQEEATKEVTEAVEEEKGEKTEEKPKTKETGKKSKE